MEEYETKEKGKLKYLIIGVGALFLAVIGSTVAYFSATTGLIGNGVVAGETNNISGSDLSLTVNKVVFTGTTAPSNDLVPADFGKTNNTLNVPDPGSLHLSNVTNMIANKCENNGYTGCHVYSITFSSSKTVQEANLLLNLSVTGAADKSQWGYALFTEAGNVASGATTNLSLLTGNAVPAAIGNGVTNLDIHNGAGLTASTPVTYYLVVYINDINVSQNSEDSNNVLGVYNGLLELQVLGGKVRADFGPLPVQPTDISNFEYSISNNYDEIDWRSLFGSETDNYVFLTNYIGSDEVVRIPSSYNINGTDYIPVVYTIRAEDEYTMDDISTGAFIKNTTITEVHLSNDVLFATTIFGSSTVNSMRSTFSGCTNLVNVTGIPSSVSNMDYAFDECTSLVNAPEIPNSVVRMQGTFWGCTNLETAPIIPSSVTIMNNTFRDCTSLSGTVTINSSNVSSTVNPFNGTVNNITVDVPEGSTTYNSINNSKSSNVTLVTH